MLADMNMKKTLIIFLCATALLGAGGCVSGNGKLPTPSANFTPKRTYAVSRDKLWQAVLDALDQNHITVVSDDKSSGIIQTDYLAGPESLLVFPVAIEQSSRYKYNITLRDESDGSIRVNVICKIESTTNSGHGSSQWNDVTPQNAKLENQLETWLYEQIEKQLGS
jgi:NlpB/DapX lipoprotein